MDASACIYVYSNIKTNIMKNPSSSPSFGIYGKMYVYIYFMFYALAIVYFIFLEFVSK